MEPVASDDGVSFRRRTAAGCGCCVFVVVVVANVLALVVDLFL